MQTIIFRSEKKYQITRQAQQLDIRISVCDAHDLFIIFFSSFFIRVHTILWNHMWPGQIIALYLIRHYGCVKRFSSSLLLCTIYAHMYARTKIQTHSHTHTRAHTYKYKYRYKHTHTHIGTHTHIQKLDRTIRFTMHSLLVIGGSIQKSKVYYCLNVTNLRRYLQLTNIVSNNVLKAIKLQYKYPVLNFTRE